MIGKLDRYDKKTCPKISKNIIDNWRPCNAMAVHWHRKLVTSSDSKMSEQWIELLLNDIFTLS